MDITKKELSAIDNGLKNTVILIKKYENFLKECSDSEFCDVFSQALNVHRKHFNMLISYLK